MHDLLELTALFRRTKFRNHNLLEAVIDPETQMGKVFGAIFRREASSDDDLRRLFPEFATDSGKLYTVKSKLKDRLLHLVFLLDLKESSFSDRQQAFHECTKRMASAQLLIGKGVRNLGISLLEQLLKYTRKFEFTELSLDALRTLRLQYSMIDGDVKKFESAEKELEALEEIWRLERLAESLYARLMVNYVQKKADKQVIGAQAQVLFDQVSPYTDEVRSYKFQLFARLLELAIYDGRHKYTTVAQQCEEALSFFETKPYKSGLSLQVFYYNLLLSSLYLREFKKAKGIFEDYIGLFEEGSFNWFKVQELYFLIAMHSGQYQEAYKVWDLVSRHPDFAGQSNVISEMWSIFGAFQHLLIRTGRIQAGAETAKEAGFRMGKFLNSLVVFSKDKRGMNIPVMVVHYLYRMAEGKFDLLTDRAEALEGYRKRYLAHEDTQRSNVFFKMLLKLPASGWNRKEAVKATSGLLSELKQTPYELANQNHEVEIMPYEALWEIALSLLPDDSLSYS